MRASNATQRTYCTLITTHALSVIEKFTPSSSAFFDHVKRDCDRHAVFPDGSLLIEGGDSFHRFWNTVCANGLLGHGLWQPRGFAGLEHFEDQPKAYMLFYTTDYRESLGELDFSVAFPSMWAQPTKDYDLKDLLISVAFKVSTSAQTRTLFARSVNSWFVSVSEKGVFGEGPVTLVSKHVEFRGRVAQFRINASASGQDTLNWLLVSVLNFGYAVSAVTDFVFDHDKSVELFTGPISSKVDRIDL